MQIRFLIIASLLAINTKTLWSQQIIFHLVPPPEDYPRTWIVDMVQDAQGYMWFASAQGLDRFDGFNITRYSHDRSNNNSIADNNVSSICADSSGVIWAGTGGYGLDKFDPVKNVFTHFKHQPGNKTSLVNNTVTAIIEDHEKNLWIGTYGGLELLDRKTGSFIHYAHDDNDPSSLSNNHVRAIYEDKQGTIWVGTGSPFVNDEGVVPDEGGLNRLDKKTGKFIRYLHDPKNPRSLVDNRIRAIFEDSHGNFWVGTAGDGLHSLDRATGIFTRYPYDGKHQKLSRPPVRKLFPWCDDHITFISEDASGALWIGTFSGGVNRYDPVTKKITFYGWQEPHLPGGFNDFNGWCAYTSRDGVLWISTMIGNLFRIDPFHHNFPYHNLNEDTQATVEDSTGTIWIGTESGLLRTQKNGKIERKYVYNSSDSNSISNSYVNNICIDEHGKFWISTYGGGFNYFDPVTEKFIRFQHEPGNSNSLINNTINIIYKDRKQNLWTGTDVGLDKMEIKTGKFTHYQHSSTDTNSLIDNGIDCFLEDSRSQLWIGCRAGINVLDNTTGKFKHYLKGNGIESIFEDATGTIWASTYRKGLFKFDSYTENFIPFVNPNTGLTINNVLSIIEDDQKNLWLFGINNISRLNPKRDLLVTYGRDYGVRRNQNGLARTTKGPSGIILSGDQSGYYIFSPDSLISNPAPPQIVITNFFLGEQLIKPGDKSPLKVPLSQAKEIQLNYKQTIFSFDFDVLHFSNPENNQHLFMLENYDNTWRSSGTEKKAFYFNVPPGNYTFRVKAANNVGVWAEKSISIIIIPPWWQTWWFWTIAGLLAVLSVYTIVRIRVRVVRKAERSKARHEKQLLELEAKALRAQMNPHFIFNCMNSIKSLIQKNEQEKAIEYLTTFSKLIRTIFQNSDKREISLYDEIETCRLYTQLESMRFGNKLNYSFDIDEQTDFKSVMVPPLILQPFIENAIWHGLMPKAEGGMIYVRVTEKGNKIYCIVEDNGIGRSVSMQNKFNDPASGHQSKGMRLTQSRLELNNSLNQRNATVEIIDKTNDIGESAGTKVILVFNEE
ncbi:MAG TPA: two-component regulator propeller domain-containing protein [Parafilimonas sp.]|nr:two-component regulator propeller domain-containing protein [Parafilimonas sp.]